jgi:negative regulator of sigma E activity
LDLIMVRDRQFKDTTWRVMHCAVLIVLVWAALTMAAAVCLVIYVGVEPVRAIRAGQSFP